jgi:hypothetical protein
MPPESVKDVFRLVLIGELDLQMTANVFYYQGVKARGTATQADYTALRALFGAVDGVFPQYLGAVSADWSYKETHIDCPTTPSLATLVSVGVSVGTGPAVALANQSAAVIRKITLWRGKHGHGRISVPAVPRVWVTGTQITNDAPYLLLADAMAQTLSDGTDTFIPGIYATHQEEGQLPNYGWVSLSTCRVNTVLGTIRRRKPGVGK